MDKAAREPCVARGEPAVAARRGVSLRALSEPCRTLLESGQLVCAAGALRFDRARRLRWRVAAGPAPIPARFAGLRAELRRQLGAARHALDRAWRGRRRWSRRGFRRYWLEPPARRLLAGACLWGDFTRAGRLRGAFRLLDGRPVDVAEEAVELPARASIGLVSGLELSDARHAAWVELLVGEGVLLVLPQLARPALPFVRVPAGSFSDATGGRTRVPRDLLVKAWPITHEEWEQVMGTRPGRFRDAGPDAPVERVSWYDACAFCNRLSQLSGLPRAYRLDGPRGRSRAGAGGPRGSLHRGTVRWTGRAGYRLPACVEWEHACRAGADTDFWCGPRLTPEAAPGHGRGRTCSVLRSAPNRWGLYALHGNVAEWCWDATRRGEQTLRLACGGGYAAPPPRCAAGARNAARPGEAYSNVGLRPVRSVARAACSRARAGPPPRR